MPHTLLTLVPSILLCIVVLRVSVVYLRVSRQAQKPDLKNQRGRLEEFGGAKGIAVDEWIEEVGGGVNFKRPKFVKLIEQIVAKEVAQVAVAYKDR